MELQKLADSLSPFERKVLPLLERHTTLGEIAGSSGLQPVEVMRALQWLQNKKIVTIRDSIKKVVNLDSNGRAYVKEGLPERRFLEALKGKKPVEEIARDAGLSEEEINVCMGILKSKGAIQITKLKGDLLADITSAGREILNKGLDEEKFLKKKFPIELAQLRGEDKAVFEALKKRKKIVKTDELKTISASLTDLGKNLLKAGLREDLIEKLTPSMLRTGAWKNKKFRHFDVKIKVPEIHSGKRQHYRAFLDNVRRKFISLGFEEMFGPVVETNFWNMDSLFMPQFHSARDIHQGYYIKEPKYADELPKDKVENVRQAHENGFGTGSKGWQYRFDVKKTCRHILRTQGTACSTRTLASEGLEIPGKYFSIARCFRYDVIDATHLADFYQTEGIVIEEGLNFGHLKNLLKMFAKEFANTDEVKITPGYFPFTEPSAELHAKHPELGWIELGGSGIFRPEVVKPLVGREMPVLAWGIGIDRIAMFKLGIKDIRQLFSHDLEFLRNMRCFTKNDTFA